MSSSKAAIVAGGALLAVAGLGWSLFNNSKTSSSTKSRAGDDLVDIDDLLVDDEEDYITAEEVVKVFDKLFLEMSQVMSHLMQQVQAIQMSGQQIPEKQLQGMVRAEMERNLVVKHKQVVEAFDMDDDCLEQATWEFIDQEDEAVKKAVERFQKLWERVTGEQVVGWRPGQEISDESKQADDILEPAKLIEVAEKYFDSLTELMKSIMDDFAVQGKNLQEPAVQQELNLKFAQNANDTGEAALEKEGVTLRQFETSVKAHGDNQAVARALGMLQMKQQQDLMKLGGGAGRG